MYNLLHVPTSLHPLLLPTEIPVCRNPPDVQKNIMWWGKVVDFSHSKHELEGVSEGLKTWWCWLRLSSPMTLFSFISISDIFPESISGSFCAAFHVPLNIACAITPQ